MLSILNFQRQAWQKLFSKDIYDIFENAGFVDRGVSVRFTPSNADKLLNYNVLTSKLDETLQETLKVDISLMDMRNDTGSVSTVSEAHFDGIDLLTFPILTEFGFVINGSKKGVVSKLRCASGWYLESSGRVDNPEKVLTLRKESSVRFRIRRTGAKSSEFSKTEVCHAQGGSLGIFEFLKACSDYATYDDIAEDLQWNRYAIGDKFGAERNMEDCAKDTLRVIFRDSNASKYPDPVKVLHERLYTRNTLRIGPERKPRFENFISFLKVVGYSLDEDITLGDTTYQKGTIITTEIASKMDDLGIEKVMIKKGSSSIPIIKCKVEEQLTYREIVTAVYHYYLLLDGIGDMDSKDNYCNKVIDSVASKFADSIEEALERITNAIRNKLMNAVALEDIITQKDISDALKPLDVMSKISEDPNYQQFDETNSLSSFEQSFRIMSGGENVPIETRDVQKSQYGRVDAFTTSESKKVGLNLSLSTMARIDKYGFITTPVYAVRNGVVDKSEVLQISAIDERGKAIAPHDLNLEEVRAKGMDEECLCRLTGEVKAVPLRQVRYQYVAACQSLGPLMSMVPAGNHDAGKRSTMSGNAQKQALPVIRRERPLVCTGTEALMDIGIIRGRDVIQSQLSKQGIFEFEEHEGATISIQGMDPNAGVTHVTYTTNYPGLTELYDYEIPWVNATIKGSLRHFRLNINANHEYGMDDIVFYANDVDVKEYAMSRETVEFGGVSKPSAAIASHAIALGNNVRVIFKSFEGFGYEDAVIVNEDFARNMGLAVSRVINKVAEVTTQEINGTILKQIFTRDITDLSDIEKSYLDEDGLPLKGTRLKPGQVLIGRAIVETATDGTTETSNASVRLQIGESGTVIDARLNAKKNKASVTLGVLETLEEGDKVSGYHGNKGVVSRIMRAEDMPYTEDGVPDLVINPLGVAARQNLGQIIEAALAAYGLKTGEIQLLEPFNDMPMKELLGKLESMGVVEKDVYDGQTGLKYPRKVMFGVMHFIRSEHVSLSKYNACSTANNKLSPRTGQPIKASGGGQKYSELSSWCLESYGATKVIDTLGSFQSDDISGINKFISEIRAGKPWQQCDIPYESHNDDLIQVYLRTLGLNMKKTAEESCLEILTDVQMRSIAHRECNIDYPKPEDVIRDPLVFGESSTRITGFTKSRKWYGYLPIGFEFVQPIVLSNTKFLKMFYIIVPKGDIKAMTPQSYKKVIQNEWYLAGFNERLGLPIFADAGSDVDASRTGICGLMQMLSQYDFENSLKMINQMLGVREEDSDIVPFIKIVDPEDPDYDKAGKLVDDVLYVTLNDDTSKLLDSRNIIMQFMLKHESPKDIFVKGLLIPPIGYRPMIRGESSSAFDKQLSAVVRTIQTLHNSKTSDKLYADYCNKAYLQIAAMAESSESEKQKSVFDEFIQHDTKNSIVRDSVLAKRIRFSGRSVISVNSKLKIDETGIPIVMATKIFEEHLVSMLMHNPGKYPTLEKFGVDKRKLRQMLSFISFQNYRGFTALLGITSNVYREFLACKEELVQMLKSLFDYYYVMLNREPSLHKFSVVGFKGIPVWTNSIQLHPLACHGFNADFDGDQMSVVPPMHPKAQEELKSLMLMSQNLINPKDGSLITSLNQDMILGMYWATVFKDNVKSLDVEKEKTQALISMNPVEIRFEGCHNSAVEELWDMVTNGIIKVQDVVLAYAPNGHAYKSTAGRILFNSLLPNLEGFTEERTGTYYKLKFDSVIKKEALNKVLKWAVQWYEDNAGVDTLALFLDRLKDFGFWMADQSAVSISIYDFAGVNAFDAMSQRIADVEKRVRVINQYAKDGYITEAERSKLVIEEWLRVRKDGVAGLKDSMDRNSNLFMMIDSSARGDVHQLMEMCGIIGNISNAKGEILETPILANYLKGLSAQDMFASSYKARAALCATQLSTAQVGATNRKLIYMVEHQHIRSESTCCSAEATWIDLEYEVPAIDSNYNLAVEDVESMPDELFDERLTRERWMQFADTIRRFSRTTMCYASTMQLIASLRLPRIIVIGLGGKPEAVNLKYKLTDSSRAMLWRRTFEPSLVDEKYKGLKMKYHKAEGDPDLCIVGDEVIKEIEKDLLGRFPIYTIMGCRSTVGICKRCFGLKYEADVLPKGNEYIGYQAIQAIGEPTQQLMLDTHKRAGGQKQTSTQGINSMLDSPMKAVDAGTSAAIVAPISGILKIVGDKAGIEKMFIEDTQLRLPDKVSVMDLKFLDGDEVEQGEILTIGDPPYKDLGKYAEYQRSQLAFWKAYLNLYSGENIMARNFELLALSQAEFGIALEDKSRILAGNKYPVQVLRNAKVKFRPVILKSDESMATRGKIYCSSFFGNTKSFLGRFAVTGVENCSDSNIGRQVLGELRSKDSEKQVGVIKESRAELLQSVDSQPIRVKRSLPVQAKSAPVEEEPVMAISFDETKPIVAVEVSTGEIIEDNFNVTLDGTMISQKVSERTGVFEELEEAEDSASEDSEIPDWLEMQDDLADAIDMQDLRTSAFEDL